MLQLRYKMNKRFIQTTLAVTCKWEITVSRVSEGWGLMRIHAVTEGKMLTRLLLLAQEIGADVCVVVGRVDESLHGQLSSVRIDLNLCNI